MKDTFWHKKIVFDWRNIESIFLVIVLTLNLGVIFLHINKFFIHPENIVIRDGFFYKSKVLDSVINENGYDFPVLSITKVSSKENLFKIIPQGEYTLYSIYNIRNYKKPLKKPKKSKLAAFFLGREKDSLTIDFKKNAFYKIQKNDMLGFPEGTLDKKELKKILFKINGGKYVISTKPIKVNSTNLGPGAYLKLYESGGLIPLTLEKNGIKYRFYLKNYKKYLLLVKKESRYRGDFNKNDKILFNFDNNKNDSIFLDYSDSKGILYKKSNEYFFYNLTEGIDSSPIKLSKKSFFLNNTFITINPYSHPSRYILFISIIFILILFITFDKRFIIKIEMKIVFLILLLLYSINYLLSYDIYFRFGMDDYFSERLLIIPFLVVIFYIFNNKSKDNLPYYVLCIALILLQLIIGEIGKFHINDYSYLILLIFLSFFLFISVNMRWIAQILRAFENIDFPEITLMFILIIIFGPIALIFKEAIQLGGIRIELATILKLPLLYYFSLCFFQLKEGSGKIHYFRYVILFSLPIFIITLFAKDQGFFYLIILFSISMVLIYFPSPNIKNKSLRIFEWIKSKGFVVIAFILIFVVLLGIGNFALKSKVESGIMRMPVDLFKTLIGRTIYHPSTLTEFETNNYQKNFIQKVGFVGKKEFQIDTPFLSSYLVNDYMYLYLILKLGLLWGLVVVVVYCLIFWFSLKAFKESEHNGPKKIAVFFYILSVSYFCFQSLYQILSQLGIRGIPFTGKEVYLLSCGRTQVVFSIILFSLLNSIVNKSENSKKDL